MSKLTSKLLKPIGTYIAKKIADELGLKVEYYDTVDGRIADAIILWSPKKDFHIYTIFLFIEDGKLLLDDKRLSYNEVLWKMVKKYYKEYLKVNA